MATTVHAAAPIPLPIEACWERFLDLTRAKDCVPGLTVTGWFRYNKPGTYEIVTGYRTPVSHGQFDTGSALNLVDSSYVLTVTLESTDGSPLHQQQLQLRFGNGTHSAALRTESGEATSHSTASAASPMSAAAASTLA